MPKLSSRTAALRQSDIRAVTFAVNAVGGINLGQGICDLPTPPAIREATHRSIEEQPAIYTPYAGIPALRERILHKVRTFNGIPASGIDEVMVSVGSTGAFAAAVMALCEPGDEVIVFEPFYGYHTGLLSLFGVTPVAVPLHAPDWTIDWDALDRAFSPRTKAVVVCTPANPCGKVWSRDELQRLLGLLERHDVWAIADEIYEYMVYDGRTHLSLASLPGGYARTLTLSGFSKTFNMTGWRLGYATGPAEALARMGLVNDLLFICAPAPLQYGLAESLLDNAYYASMLEDYVQKRSLFCETLEACGFLFSWPQGAYYVLADFSPLASRFPGFEDDQAACATLIREAGIGAVPGSAFFTRPEDGRTMLRFCYAKELPVLEDACARLRRAFG